MNTGHGKRASITAFLLLLKQVVFAQDITDISQQFASYTGKQLQEKIYVHTDKATYIAGETIWFKIYQVDASHHRPLDISKVVYVEVMDQDNKAVLQAKVATKEGWGSGAIVLPTTMPTGNYLLRAYTSWMQNFPAQFFFHQPLSVINTFRKPDWKALDRPGQLSLALFPEGGNLVSGLSARVAFLCSDQHGKGISGKGYLLDSKSDTIARFATYLFGRGSFEFTPKTNERYAVIVKADNGQMVKKELPEIHAQGYTLRVAPTSNQQYKLVVNSTLTSAQYVYCFIHTRNHIKQAQKMLLQNGKAELIIDRQALGDGISHLTIFDSNKQPVCERLLYKHPGRRLSFNITTDKKTYGKREKINLQIQTNLDSLQLLPANLSLAVYRMDSLQTNDHADIAAYLWLTSDLQGYIESPSYYMKHPEDLTAIENLMLTNGWRRFDWKLLTDHSPSFTYLPEYEGHIIKGILTNSSGQAIRNTPTFLSVPGKRIQLSYATTNHSGQVQHLVKDLWTESGMVMLADSVSERMQFKPISPFSDQASSYPLPRLELKEEWSRDLLLASKSMQVQNVYALSTVDDSIYLAANDTIPFYGKPDQTYYLDDYTRFPSMDEVLREFVSEVRVRKQGSNFQINVLNAPFKTFFELPPLVLVDGLPVLHANKIMSLDPLKVKKIEVVARKYYYGNFIGNGIVSYRTYAGDMGGMELDANAVVIDYEGLQRKRRFSAPMYENEEQRKSRLPDYRTTLFWTAEVPLLNTSKSSFSFYSSDVKGHYVIHVQGMTKEGAGGSGTYTIAVGN